MRYWYCYNNWMLIAQENSRVEPFCLYVAYLPERPLGVRVTWYLADISLNFSTSLCSTASRYSCCACSFGSSGKKSLWMILFKDCKENISLAMLKVCMILGWCDKLGLTGIRVRNVSAKSSQWLCLLAVSFCAFYSLNLPLIQSKFLILSENFLCKIKQISFAKLQIWVKAGQLISFSSNRLAAVNVAASREISFTKTNDRHFLSKMSPQHFKQFHAMFMQGLGYLWANHWQHVSLMSNLKVLSQIYFVISLLVLSPCCETTSKIYTILWKGLLFVKFSV